MNLPTLLQRVMGAEGYGLAVIIEYLKHNKNEKVIQLEQQRCRIKLFYI
jgi:hypothetical protein